MPDMSNITEVHMVPTGQATAKQIVMHNVWGANAVGSFATELIKAAMMTGPAQSPQVVVDRCVEIADLTFRRFEEKGWLIEMPSWETLNEGGPTRAGFTASG